VGNLIEVSATCASLPDGSIAAPGDIYKQTKLAFGIIEAALKELGASLDDVVRNTFYIRDQSRWKDVARVHSELFAQRRPAISFIFVSGWPFEGEEVEVQTTAYVGEDDS
jgi:enamine deaminase RidA (YjgF/YER057c/UK114 family)